MKSLREEALSLNRFMPVHIKSISYIFGTIISSFAFINLCFRICDINNTIWSGIVDAVRVSCTILYLCPILFLIFVCVILKWNFDDIRRRQVVKDSLICGILLLSLYIEKIL